MEIVDLAVIGGGPAGMHAARILAEQGNRVHLVEAVDELGGQMRYSSRGAVDYGYLVQYLTRQMDKLGVEVSLGTRADTGLVKSIAPDAVVVATGAVGVFGPTRMAYDRAIGAVRHVANLMTSLVHESYG